MVHKDRATEAIQALAKIREIWGLKVEAQSNIEKNLRLLSSSKESLEDVSRESRTSENAAYLDAAEEAWKSSIEAHELSIEAFQMDLQDHDEDIQNILRETSGSESRASK